MLTINDTQQFDYIVASARTSGWLRPNDRMVVIESHGFIVVTRVTEGERQQKRYVHDPDWHFQFLRDVAHGTFRDSSRPG